MLVGSIAFAAVALEGCAVKNNVEETRNILGDGKYISIKGKHVEYVSYMKEKILSSGKKLPPLLAKVEAALAASTVYNKEVTIDFEQLKKDVADISIAVEEDTLTVPQMERVWQALGQMEDGLRCTLRQDGLDIQWLEDEQELRINPAARTLREILEKSETRE